MLTHAATTSGTKRRAEPHGHPISCATRRTRMNSDTLATYLATRSRVHAPAINLRIGANETMQ